MAILGVSAHSVAAPVSFSSIGSSITANYNSIIGYSWINASVTYTLSTISGNTATFGVAVVNNTPAASAGQNRLNALGIDIITPLVTGVTDTSSTWGTSVNTNFPGFQQVAFCAWGGQNCSGGSDGGVGEGGSESFDFTLTFASAPTLQSLTFDTFVAKFQSVGSNSVSIEVAGCVGPVGTNCGGNGGGIPPQEIPAPGTLALAGLALLGLGLARRRV